VTTAAYPLIGKTECSQFVGKSEVAIETGIPIFGTTTIKTTIAETTLTTKKMGLFAYTETVTQKTGIEIVETKPNIGARIVKSPTKVEKVATTTTTSTTKLNTLGQNTVGSAAFGLGSSIVSNAHLLKDQKYKQFATNVVQETAQSGATDSRPSFGSHFHCQPYTGGGTSCC